MRSAANGLMLFCAWTMACTLVLDGMAHGASPASVATAASAAPNATTIKPLEAKFVEISFVSAHAAGPITPSAINAWGGERTGQETTLSDRVVSYQISADLDASKHAVDRQ